MRRSVVELGKLTDQMLRASREALVLGEIVEEVLDVPTVRVDRRSCHEAICLLLRTGLDAGTIPHLPGLASHSGSGNLLANRLDCAVAGKPGDVSLLHLSCSRRHIPNHKLIVTAGSGMIRICRGEQII